MLSVLLVSCLASQVPVRFPYGVVFVCLFYFIIIKALFPPAIESLRSRGARRLNEDLQCSEHHRNNEVCYQAPSDAFHPLFGVQAAHFFFYLFFLFCYFLFLYFPGFLLCPDEQNNWPFTLIWPFMSLEGCRRMHFGLRTLQRNNLIRCWSGGLEKQPMKHQWFGRVNLR